MAVSAVVVERLQFRYENWSVVPPEQRFRRPHGGCDGSSVPSAL